VFNQPCESFGPDPRKHEEVTMRKTLPPAFSEFLRVVVKSIAERHAGPAIKGQGRPALIEDPQKLHRAFYEVVRLYQKEFPQLADLHFITAGAYPYSPELTEALDCLQMSGAISRDNPSFERFSPTYYEDTPRVIKAGRRRLVGNDPKKQNAFDRIVEYLDQRLSVGA
jgi:hypothetical protein